MMDPELLDIQLKGGADDHPFQKRQIMKTIYRDAIDDLPSNAPEPCGRIVQTSFFCDSDHAGDRVSFRLYTGILFCLNMAPISWFLKKTKYCCSFIFFEP